MRRRGWSSLPHRSGGCPCRWADSMDVVELSHDRRRQVRNPLVGPSENAQWTGPAQLPCCVRSKANERRPGFRRGRPKTAAAPTLSAVGTNAIAVLLPVHTTPESVEQSVGVGLGSGLAVKIHGVRRRREQVNRELCTAWCGAAHPGRRQEVQIDTTNIDSRIQNPTFTFSLTRICLLGF